MSRGFADVHLSSKGQVAVAAAMYDWPGHRAERFHAMCDGKGPTLTVVTTTNGEFCGVTSNFLGGGDFGWVGVGRGWVEDPEGVVFCPAGPHFPERGEENVYHHPSIGTAWHW